MSNPVYDKIPVLATLRTKHDDAISRGQDMYSERNKLFFLINRIPVRDLKRLNVVLRALDDHQLRMVAAYAEGLASWDAPEPQSGDVDEPAGG